MNIKKLVDANYNEVVKFSKIHAENIVSHNFKFIKKNNYTTDVRCNKCGVLICLGNIINNKVIIQYENKKECLQDWNSTLSCDEEIIADIIKNEKF